MERKKYKMILTLLISAFLLLTVGGLCSLAYLNQTTDTVTNHFAGSTFDITVNEEFQNGDSIKNNVEIHNTGTVSMYVRVKMLVQSQDKKGVIIANPIVVDDLNSRGIEVTDFVITEINNWIKVGEYYYYPELINPDEEVLFFKSANLRDDIVFKEKYTPILTISAQGIQENTIKSDKVWNEIQIDSNNKLIPSVED